jgi:hypothetical protein
MILLSSLLTLPHVAVIDLHSPWYWRLRPCPVGILPGDFNFEFLKSLIFVHIRNSYLNIFFFSTLVHIFNFWKPSPHIFNFWFFLSPPVSRSSMLTPKTPFGRTVCSWNPDHRWTSPAPLPGNVPFDVKYWILDIPIPVELHELRCQETYLLMWFENSCSEMCSTNNHLTSCDIITSLIWKPYKTGLTF